MAVRDAIQARIDAQQDLDALTYGIRSIELCRSAWGASPCHVGQIAEACEVGARLLERPAIVRDNGTLFLLKRARKVARERLADAIAAQREFGSARQLRLALAA